MAFFVSLVYPRLLSKFFQQGNLGISKEFAQLGSTLPVVMLLELQIEHMLRICINRMPQVRVWDEHSNWEVEFK